MIELGIAISLEAKYLLDKQEKLFHFLERETWFLIYMIPSIDFVWGRQRRIN